MENWEVVHKSKNEIQVELIKNHLENNGLEVFVFKSNDLVYPVFGEIELKIKSKDVEQAKILIKEIILND